MSPSIYYLLMRSAMITAGVGDVPIDVALEPVGVGKAGVYSVGV